MELFQSLICWQGNDNRQRFITINLASYFVFIITSVAFSQMLTLSFLILFILIGFNLFTTQRRLNDAGLKKNWLILPSATLLITATIILLTTSGVFYWLLLLPLLLSALLLTYPERKNKTYIMGYQGPVDLTRFEVTPPQNVRRIEPSLYAPSSPSDMLTPKQPETNFYDETNHSASEKQDLGELIRLSLLSHQNALITLAGVVSVIVVAIVISLIISNKNIPTDNKENIQTSEKPQHVQTMAKNHPIVLPDNFTLMLSDFNGLTIHWTGDYNQETRVWSQLTTVGENACKEVTFNKGNTFRTLEVTIENNTLYYASFSPLDTKALVRAIAYQSNFTLCGYEFSLKGSQAVVGKNDIYSEYLAN